MIARNLLLSISRTIMSLLRVIILGGAGPCAETQTQTETPATVNEGGDDDQVVTLALDENEDGQADDQNGDGAPDQTRRGTLRKLMACGAGIYTVAKANPAGIIAASHACFDQF